jgi:hypothetical protein
MLSDDQLFERAVEYCKSRNIRILRQDCLGYGSDGTVWRSSLPTAVKVLHRPEVFAIELECYERLKRAGVNKINGLNVPMLEGSSQALQVIEIQLVKPPYLLDFGKARIDGDLRRMYDRQLMNNAKHEWRERFPKRWQQVAGVLAVLRKQFGIHYLDPKLGNISFGDEDDDDEDWDKEPTINYDDYE